MLVRYGTCESSSLASFIRSCDNQSSANERDTATHGGQLLIEDSVGRDTAVFIQVPCVSCRVFIYDSRTWTRDRAFGID